MNKIFILSTVFTLMSWQGLFAGAPEFSGEPEVLVKPKVSTTAQSQGPLLGQMIPDTMGRILAHLPFTDGWVLLSSVDKTHRHRIDVWTVFALAQGTSLTKDKDIPEKIRGKIIGESQETLLAAIPSGEASVTPDIMINLLQSAQETPFLWDMLIDTLRERMYPQVNNPSSGVFGMNNSQEVFNRDAESGGKIFTGVPTHPRIACLGAVAKKTVFYNDTCPTNDARDAQARLILPAMEGTGLFAGISREGRLTFLENITEYKNSKGESKHYATGVQDALIRAADGGEGVFTGISREERLAYLENVAAHKNPEGKSTSYAKSAQRRLLNAADRGGGVLTGISREDRLAYLGSIMVLKTFDDKWMCYIFTSYAESAQRTLFDAAGRGDGVFAGISREERLAYLENAAAWGDDCDYYRASIAANVIVDAADRGDGLFEGRSREERFAYLEDVAARKRLDGGSTPCATSAQSALINSANRGDGLFFGISREGRLTYVKKKSEQGILRGTFVEGVLKNLQ